MFMRSFKFSMLIMFFAATTAVSVAANFYVRKGATGANTGSDWNNAWNEMSQINLSKVACGDTIWLAGGTYSTPLTLAKTCTSASPLLIKRVLSTDSVPVAAPGWNSSYNSQVIIKDSGNVGIRLNGITYVTVDGRVGDVASGVSYGISVQCSSQTSCDGIDDGNQNNNYTITHVEVYGPPCVMAQSCSGNGASGINLPYGGSGFTYDHVYIHQWGEAIRAVNWTNDTIQYSNICCTHNDNIQHEDVMYVNPPFNNVTMKYNRIWQSPNDGIFFDQGGANGFYFYGNVYYHSGGQLITFKSGYTKATNIYYYNNVFENDGTYGDYQPGWLDFTGADSTSGEMANNVMENMYIVSSPPNANHNAYSIKSDSDGGTGSISYTAGGQFVNESASNPSVADFHLTSAGVSAFAAGKTLAAPYNLDPDGTTRGTGGSWYIGAYQSQASGPAVPTNLTGVVH